MKRVKTAIRNLLGNDLLTAIIRICHGPSPEEFDATSALNKFMETKDRRTMQNQRKKYKPREKHSRVDTLMDIDSDDEESDEDVGNVSDNDQEIDVTFDEVVDYE